MQTGTHARVAVTGLGSITPTGNSADDFATAMFAGRTGIAAFSPEEAGAPTADPGLRFHTWARVKNFDATQYLSTPVVTMTSPAAQFGIVAARQAINQSGLTAHYDPAGIAVVTGCSCGGRDADEQGCRNLYGSNARVPPTTILRTMASSGASGIAIELGLGGPALNLSTACASGTHAIGLAFHMVRSGLAEAALAGGLEAPLTFGFLRAWDSMRVVSPTQCRAFSADRDGMTLGEGAAILALEPLERAEARGARIFAEIVGFGMSSDAHHLTQPKPEGAARAIVRALADAETMGVEGATARVGYINAHGTGTLANDAAEAAAIHLALREFAPRIPVSATKPLHGHSIGAAGAIEILATILALDRGLLPHTAGLTSVDSALNLDIIQTGPRPLEPGKDLALSNSLAFGGLNAVLVLRRYVGKPAIR